MTAGRSNAGTAKQAQLLTFTTIRSATLSCCKAASALTLTLLLLSVWTHVERSYGMFGMSPQVLAEQARRVGITIEAENALEQSAARAAVSKKKKDPGYSLEISSIHRRVKEMMRSRGTTPEAEAVASKGPVYQPLQDAESDLPPGWEARLDESSGETLCLPLSLSLLKAVKVLLTLPGSEG